MTFAAQFGEALDAAASELTAEELAHLERVCETLDAALARAATCACGPAAYDDEPHAAGCPSLQSAG